MPNSIQDRGILTEADREFLRGNSEIKRERDVRSRIRQRTRNAIQDFGPLLNHMEARDRRQILDEFAERHDEEQARAQGEEREQGPPELAWDILYEPDAFWYGVSGGGLRHMQAFITLLLMDDFVYEQELPEAKFELLLEKLFSKGLEDAFGQRGCVVQADVNIDIHEYDVDPESLRERFERGPADITDKEVEWLIQLRDIEWEEYTEYLLETRHSEKSE